MSNQPKNKIEVNSIEKDTILLTNFNRVIRYSAGIVDESGNEILSFIDSSEIVIIPYLKNIKYSNYYLKSINDNLEVKKLDSTRYLVKSNILNDSVSYRNNSNSGLELAVDTTKGYLFFRHKYVNKESLDTLDQVIKVNSIGTLLFKVKEK